MKSGREREKGGGNLRDGGLTSMSEWESRLETERMGGCGVKKKKNTAAVWRESESYVRA